MIHLICTVEARRVALLPQFVRHYKDLGVDHFLISLHVEEGTSVSETNTAYHGGAERLREEGVCLTSLLKCKFDAMALRKHHDELQEQLPQQDWVVWADVDEFQEYPNSLPSLLEVCDTEQINVIRGRFLDRITLDGSLATFDPDKSIWDQYPIGCDITERILMGQTNKVVCSKAYVGIKYANHDPLKGQELKWASFTSVVHHFKWDSTVVERLEFRLRPDWKIRCPWWIQSQRAIDHISQTGKLDIRCLTLRKPERGRIGMRAS